LEISGLKKSNTIAAKESETASDQSPEASRVINNFIDGQFKLLKGA